MLSQSSGCTIWKKTALCYTYIVVNKVQIDGKSDCLRLKESDLLKSKHQTQRPLLYSNQHVKRIPLSNYHVNSADFYLTLFKINLLLCRHFYVSSVLLFNRTFGSNRAIIIFSVRQKSHLLVPHLYRDAYDFMVISPICFFNVQRYLDSSVSLI